MKTTFVLFGLILTSNALAQFVGNTAECLNPDEVELFERLNQYRVANGRPSIPISKSLSSVAQWHTWDIITNNPAIAPCNLHSWSNARPNLWSSVCYTPDHANSAGMWNKPREITNNVYTAFGFEISAIGYATPQAALQGWVNSPAHNDVMLNNGVWNTLTWRSVGVGFVGNSANIWFGDMVDPLGQMRACIGPVIFSDGFEGD